MQYTYQLSPNTQSISVRWSADGELYRIEDSNEDTDFVIGTEVKDMHRLSSCEQAVCEVTVSERGDSTPLFSGTFLVTVDTLQKRGMSHTESVILHKQPVYIHLEEPPLTVNEDMIETVDSVNELEYVD